MLGDILEMGATESLNHVQDFGGAWREESPRRNASNKDDSGFNGFSRQWREVPGHMIQCAVAYVPADTLGRDQGRKLHPQL